MRIDPAKVTDAFLGELGQALRGSDDESSRWLDLDAAQLVAGCPSREFEQSEPPVHSADEEKQAHAQTVAMREDTSGRYRLIIPQFQGGRLHRFANGLEEEKVRNAVYGAMRGGGGAYRRVRDALYRLGRQQLWFDFEAAEDRRDARAWLASVGAIDPEDPT